MVACSLSCHQLLQPSVQRCVIKDEEQAAAAVLGRGAARMLITFIVAALLIHVAHDGEVSREGITKLCVVVIATQASCKIELLTLPLTTNCDLHLIGSTQRTGPAARLAASL
jgi:hypothetical protein